MRRRVFFSLLHLPKRSAAVKIVLIWSVAANTGALDWDRQSSHSGPFFYALEAILAILNINPPAKGGEKLLKVAQKLDYIRESLSMALLSLSSFSPSPSLREREPLINLTPHFPPLFHFTRL
jgi:hypothetical protein